MRMYLIFTCILAIATVNGLNVAGAEDQSIESGNFQVEIDVDANDKQGAENADSNRVIIFKAGNATAEIGVPGIALPTARFNLARPSGEASAKYRLGVSLSEVGETLAAQLKLEAGQGLVIDGVAQDSAAAKAGLQRHDVVIKAGDTDVEGMQSLVDALNASEGAELALQVIREGKRQNVVVAPQKAEAITVRAQPIEGDVDIIRNWIGAAGEHVPFRVKVIGPGFVLGNQPPLPEGVKLQITREGEKEPQIVVSRGEESWTVTPETLDKLPDDLRKHVAPLVADNAAGATATIQAAPGVPPRPVVPRWQPLPGRRMQVIPLEQADDVNDRLEKVERELEKIREQLKDQ